MREYSFRKDGFTFERVSKATARRVFNNNMPIMLCPCNLRPETGLFSTVVQNGKHLNTTFETLLNTFEYYNCTTNETGRYTAFYIPVTEVDRFTGETPTAATLGTVKQYDYNFINNHFCLILHTVIVLLPEYTSNRIDFAILHKSLTV